MTRILEFTFSVIQLMWAATRTIIFQNALSFCQSFCLSMCMYVFSDVSGKCQSKIQNHTMSGLESTEKDPCYHFHLELKPEEDHHSQVQAPDCPTTQNLHTLKQIPPISSVADFDNKHPIKCSSKTFSNGISPKLKQKLLGLFKKDVGKTDEIQRQEREQVTASKCEDQSYLLCQSDAEQSLDKVVSTIKEDAASSVPEVRTLQVVALQKTPFGETMISEDLGMDVQVPERVSDLRAFWEKESTGSQTNDDTNSNSFTSVGTLASKDPTTVCDVEIMTNNGSDSLETTADGLTDTSHDGCGLSIPIPEEDGTYRAKPVIVYEETDESLTSSLTEVQISEPRENIICSGPSLIALRTEAQGEVAASNPFSSEEDSPVQVSQCNENATSSKTIPLRVNEDNPTCEMISTETDQRASSDSTENSKAEGQMSPSKNKVYAILKTSRMLSKGFVSPDRSPLKSSSAAPQMQPIHSQSSIYTESQERPVSPRKSATPRPREQGEEVRRSPSKTCHPKALPRETSGTKASSREGSPLKTFQINIEPQIKTADEEHVKPTPVPRQKKSPLNEVKEKNHTDTKQSTDCFSSDPPSNPEDRGACFGPNSLKSSTSPQSKRGLPISPTRLARSYVPQDYEHYLGPQEKAYIPPFYTGKRITAESDVGHRNQTDSLTISCVGQNQDKTTRACSLPRASLSSELLIIFSSSCTHAGSLVLCKPKQLNSGVNLIPPTENRLYCSIFAV